MLPFSVLSQLYRSLSFQTAIHNLNRKKKYVESQQNHAVTSSLKNDDVQRRIERKVAKKNEEPKSQPNPRGHPHHLKPSPRLASSPSPPLFTNSARASCCAVQSVLSPPSSGGGSKRSSSLFPIHLPLPPSQIKKTISHVAFCLTPAAPIGCEARCLIVKCLQRALF